MHFVSLQIQLSFLATMVMIYKKLMFSHKSGDHGVLDVNLLSWSVIVKFRFLL